MPETNLDRREFASYLAGGAAIAPSALLASFAAAAPPADGEADTNDPADVERARDLTSIAADELVLELARRLDSHALSVEQLEEIRNRARVYLERSRSLSDFPLVNSDEPGFVFRAAPPHAAS